MPPIGQDREDVRIPLPKVVYAALEYEGPTWTEWRSKIAVQSAKQKTWNPDLATRLFVVDAAKTAEELRARFPDIAHHLIVRALVRAVPGTNLNPDRNPAPEWHGYVVEILPNEVHVPLPLASALARLDPRPGTAPRYAVTLCYGRHFEPWISAIDLLRK